MSKRPVYALIDCNSFYASCEKIFRPDLKDSPVIVLSNNDGVVIARSPEAKALGIKMGDPYFKVRDFLDANGVVAFSSNYALYGDISARVTQTIESMASRLETYSIDESFVDLGGFPEPLADYARAIQARVLQWTGMPVGIGIGHTKTLAKAAQHASKLYKDRTGGVVDLRSDHAVEWLLQRMPTGDVWGVGRRLSTQLEAEGVTTAWQLANLDPKTVRQRYGVVLERTVRELKGESCIELQETEPDKQAICTSKMFGTRITTIEAMRQAVATYMHRATQKLRDQNSLAGVFRLSIRTSPLGNWPKYANAITCHPPHPTDDALLLTNLAVQGLQSIWRDGFKYSKAEILLLDLRKRGEFTNDLFAPAQSLKSDQLMGVMDKINGKYGRNTLHSARMPVQAAWSMKRELMSRRYTTSINELMRFNAH